jgi:hypothetical protein
VKRDLVVDTVTEGHIDAVALSSAHSDLIEVTRAREEVVAELFGINNDEMT